ncbi:MAG: nucleotidyltransferase domain-containing protein [Chloroflexota bacterium]
MAKTTTNLRQVIKSFRRELRKMGIHSERVVVFGSYARGTASEDSDIDLFIVSRDWEAYNLRERLEILGVAAARILEPVQAQGITPREIETKQVPMYWWEAVKKSAAA